MRTSKRLVAFFIEALLGRANLATFGLLGCMGESPLSNCDRCWKQFGRLSFAGLPSAATKSRLTKPETRLQRKAVILIATQQAVKSNFSLFKLFATGAPVAALSARPALPCPLNSKPSCFAQIRGRLGVLEIAILSRPTLSPSYDQFKSC